MTCHLCGAAVELSDPGGAIAICRRHIPEHPPDLGPLPPGADDGDSIRLRLKPRPDGSLSVTAPRFN